MPDGERDADMPLPLGVFADTGQFLNDLSEETVLSLAEHREEEGAEESALRDKADTSSHFGVDVDTDPNDLSQAGWAVLFAPGVDHKIKEALRPLLEHRRAQVADESLFQIFDDATGYRPGDTASSWLARHNVRMDVVDARLGVPYYVMLVASPQQIPFEFQYGLDIYWAVGRIWFETEDEFRQYAESVVRYEQAAEVATSRQIACFAPRHDFDRATQLFCKQVAEPMVHGHGTKQPIGQRQSFSLQAYIGETATKHALHSICAGDTAEGAPAVLFSGSHGMAFFQCG